MNSISVNDMLERLQDYIFGELASGVGIEHHVLTQNTVAVLAATIVVGPDRLPGMEDRTRLGGSGRIRPWIHHGRTDFRVRGT